MPLKGFVINKGLSAFLTVRPIQVSRSPAAYSLKASLTEIQKQMQAIFLAKNSSADQVKSHCIDLKNDVQLATEETIMLINKYNQELIEKIDDYQRDCLDSIEINENFTFELSQSLEDMKLFKNEWSQYLTKAQLDEDILGQVNERAVQLITKAKQDMTKLDDLIFHGFKLAFKRNDASEVARFNSFFFHPKFFHYEYLKMFFF